MTNPIKIKRALRLAKKYDALQVFINREVPPSVENKHKELVSELSLMLGVDIDSFDAHLRQCNEHLEQMIYVSPY